MAATGTGSKYSRTYVVRGGAYNCPDNWLLGGGGVALGGVLVPVVYHAYVWRGVIPYTMS